MVGWLVLQTNYIYFDILYLIKHYSYYLIHENNHRIPYYLLSMAIVGKMAGRMHVNYMQPTLLSSVWQYI